MVKRVSRESCFVTICDQEKALVPLLSNFVGKEWVPISKTILDQGLQMSFLGSGNPQIFPKSNAPQTVAGRKRPEELPPLVGIEYQKEFFVIMGNRRFFAYKECGMDLEFKMILHSEDYTTLENQEEREAFKFKAEFPGPVEWVLPQECGKKWVRQKHFGNFGTNIPRHFE